MIYDRRAILFSLLLAPVYLSPASEPRLTKSQSVSPRAGLRSVAEWESMFLRKWVSDDVNVYRPLSISADSWDHYNLAFGLDGNNAMYLASGNRQYIDRAILYAINVIDTARASSSLGPDAFGDQYLGWTSKRSDVRGQEVPLFESFLWRYVTDLLRIIHYSPDLSERNRYRASYRTILEFAERNIVDKWLSRGSDAYIYRERTHMAAHWAYICMNLALLTNDVSRKARMIEVYENVNQHLPNYRSSLRAQLRTHTLDSAAYVWSDIWEVMTPPGQDVAHGNGVIAYVVEAHDRGLYWSTSDISAFCALLLSVIWRRQGIFPFYVAGYDSGGNGWITDGFMKLGRYSEEIQARLQDYGGAIPDNNGGTIQFYGNGALNAHLLGTT
jgi:hypothetical protein